MLKYSDLTSRFIAYRREQERYWDHLQQSAYQLLRDMDFSLDLPSKTWTDQNGKVIHYVDIGSTNSGEFKRVHPMEFQSDDLRYNFAIRITLEESPEELPKGFYIQHVTMFASDDVIAVTLAGVNGDIALNTSKTVADGQFSQVVEAIKQRLIEALTLKISG
ncbi:hypothetical protein [Pseudomonas sp. ZS1P83]